MRAVILAAGRGSRLGSLTDLTPKAMTKLNGKPLLERAIASLRAGGVTEIAVVTGYKSEVLAGFGDRHFRNDQWDRTGIFQSLTCARDWLEHEACIVSYGDIFYTSETVSRLVAGSGELNITYDPNALDLWCHRFSDPLDDLERFSVVDGLLKAIGGKPLDVSEVQGQYMGLFKTTPDGWRRLCEAKDQMPSDTRSNVDMTTLLSAVLERGVAATPQSGPWGEIDCPSDIVLYEKMYPDL